MGRVTEREANRATEIARGVDGVQKVVRVFEVISEAELANQSQPKPCVRAAASAAAHSRGPVAAGPRRGRPRLAVQPPDQARGVGAVAALGLQLGVELVDQRRHRQARAVAPRFVEHQPRGPCASSRPRSRNRTCRRSWSCRGCPSASFAPRPCRSRRARPSCRARPAGRRRSPSLRPCTSPAMQIWFTILASWPAPLGPSSVNALAKAIGRPVALVERRRRRRRTSRSARRFARRLGRPTPAHR